MCVYVHGRVLGGVVCGDVLVLQRVDASVSHGDDGGQIHQRAAAVFTG